MQIISNQTTKEFPKVTSVFIDDDPNIYSYAIGKAKGGFAGHENMVKLPNQTKLTTRSTHRGTFSNSQSFVDVCA